MAAKLKDQISHVFEPAGEPLSELARLAVSGMHGPDAFAFIEARGLEAVRQLLKFLAAIPGSVGCSSDEQFFLGYEVHLATPGEESDLAKWRTLLGEVLALAMVREPTDLGDAEYELAQRASDLVRRAAPLVSPRLVAWGRLPAKSP